MPTRPPYSPIDIPEKNVLSFIFPVDTLNLSDEPTWIDAANPSVYLTPQRLFSKAKRLAVGIEGRRGPDGELLAKPGDVVLILSPNQILIPAAYLGVVGSARIFSGVNTTFSARGTLLSRWVNQSKNPV
jgi:4-coumarate--CoA ligase